MLDKKNRNALILLVSLMLLLFSTFYFFLGIQFQETGKLPDIGEVFKKNNDLRRRVDGSLSWVDIEHSSKIYPGDKVFTGASSLAQLNLLDLAEIGMNASTLLRIDEKAAEGMSVQGGLGFFTAKLSKKVTKTALRLKHASFELNGSDSEVHVNGLEDKTMVAALGGKVTYRTFDSTGKVGALQTLGSNQVLGMNRAGAATVVNLPARLIAPTVSQEVALRPNVPVHFQWKVLNPEAKLNLQLSKSPAFDSIFYQKDITGLSDDEIQVPSLEQGVIYWRVVEPGREEYYHAQQFEYQPLEPPVIFDPGQRQNYPAVTAIGPEFSWEKKFDFTYEGEIQQLDGGIAGAQKFSGPQASYLAKKLVPGHYQIRVRGMKDRLATDWSEWRLFSVGDVERDGVEMVSPAQMATATFIFPKKEIAFRWTGGGAQTQIQVSSDESFKDIVFEGITDKTTMNWRPQKEGRYFWRVKSSPLSKSGSVRSVIVVEPKLALIAPKDRIGYLFRESGIQSVRFQWEDVSLDNRYVFEYAGSPDFKKVYESVTLDQAEHELQFPNREELIYWRVKTANQTGPTRMFRIYREPDLKLPILDLVKVKIQEETTIFGGTADRTPTQLGPDFVEIFLPQIEEAVSYRVEVNRDYGGKSKVMSKGLNSPIFKWSNPKPGEYYWRVSYQNAKGQWSGKSEPSRLIVEPKDAVEPTSKKIFQAPY